MGLTLVYRFQEKTFALSRNAAIIRASRDQRENAGEMDEWFKSHAWKACIGS